MEELNSLLRMSLLEHLEELRDRIITALWGFGFVFLLSWVGTQRAHDLWDAP